MSVGVFYVNWWSFHFLPIFLSFHDLSILNPHVHRFPPECNVLKRSDTMPVESVEMFGAVANSTEEDH